MLLQHQYKDKDLKDVKDLKDFNESENTLHKLASFKSEKMIFRKLILAAMKKLIKKVIEIILRKNTIKITSIKIF